MATTRWLASTAASAVAEICTPPLDVATTRLQILSMLSDVDDVALHATGEPKTTLSKPPAYTGMVDCLVRTAEREGLGALWKGLTPALVRQVCYSSLTLVLYEPIRDLFHKGSGEPGYAVRLFAGGSAGAISISVFNPVEVWKTQVQAAAVYVTLLAVCRQVLRRDGIAGFWSGLGPNVARTFLVNAAELGTYDHAVHLLAPLLGHGTIAGQVAASFVAGFCSACTSTPADVIKTRLMQQAGADANERQYSGVVDALATTLRREGCAALYKGSCRCSRASCCGARSSSSASSSCAPRSARRRNNFS